ncbi:MAG TPA: hypothetical protein VK116_16655 [Planctomycetota bacterium]|nr:hypothetical protein [Planctomycetota bacterium]
MEILELAVRKDRDPHLLLVHRVDQDLSNRGLRGRRRGAAARGATELAASLAAASSSTPAAALLALGGFRRDGGGASVLVVIVEVVEIPGLEPVVVVIGESLGPASGPGTIIVAIIVGIARVDVVRLVVHLARIRRTGELAPPAIRARAHAADPGARALDLGLFRVVVTGLGERCVGTDRIEIVELASAAPARRLVLPAAATATASTRAALVPSETALGGLDVGERRPVRHEVVFVVVVLLVAARADDRRVRIDIRERIDDFRAARVLGPIVVAIGFALLEVVGQAAIDPLILVGIAVLIARCRHRIAAARTPFVPWLAESRRAALCARAFVLAGRSSLDEPGAEIGVALVDLPKHGARLETLQLALAAGAGRHAATQRGRIDGPAGAGLARAVRAETRRRAENIILGRLDPADLIRLLGSSRLASRGAAAAGRGCVARLPGLEFVCLRLDLVVFEVRRLALERLVGVEGL